MARLKKAQVMTERDRAVLAFIGIGGLASLKQLNRTFWQKADGTHALEGTTRDRLSQLEKAGWVKAEIVDERTRGELVFTLTAKGAKEFSRAERERFIIGLPAAHERPQQLLAQDARIALDRQYAAEGKQIIDWKGERELRSDQSRQNQAHYKYRRGQRSTATGTSANVTPDIADAQATIRDARGQETILNVEIDGQYWGKMIEGKAATFGKTGQPTLWVTTPERAARVSQAIAPYSNISILVVGDE